MKFKRLKSNMLLWLVVIVVIAAARYNDLGNEDTTPAGRDTNPDIAALMQVKTPDGTPSQLVDYEGFTLSFNAQEHVPNWVAWELTAQEAAGGNAEKGNFAPDKSVRGCPTLADYKGSGYDRGHMTPSADMKWSIKGRSDCYYLTNMCPQDHNFNANIWGHLEKSCRSWAIRDSSIIIITGPILADGVTKRIGRNGVAVPKRFFKVLLEPYHDPIRATGFIFPNGDAPGGAQTHIVTVDEVERATGFDFFAALPDSLEEAIESRQWKYNDWALPQNKRRRK